MTESTFLRLLVAQIAVAAVISVGSDALAQGTPVIRLGAWNIEWLGTPGNRSGVAKNVAQSPRDIAAYIGAAEVDVLALEEIGDDDEDEDTITNSTLDAAFELLNEGGGDWTYRIFPKDRHGSRNQCIGVAWNRSRARLIGSPYKIPIVDDDDEFNLWDRTPYAVQFSFGSGRTDIVVVPLHMKSNVGGVQTTREQRGREADHLVDALHEVYVQFNDQDVVLLGDTNILRTNEPAANAFRRAGYVDLNASDMPTTFHGPAPFDRVFVRRNQPEFRGAEQEAIELEGLSPEQHKRKLSDHYMVVSAVHVLPDDDGNENSALLAANDIILPCNCGDSSSSASEVNAKTSHGDRYEAGSAALALATNRDLPFDFQNASQHAPSDRVETPGKLLAAPDDDHRLSNDLVRLKIQLQRLQLKHASEALGTRSDRRFGEEANVLRDAVWPNKTIRVSWENPSDSNRQEREWVRAAITRTWQQESGLRFVGWDPADDNTDGIRIRIADDHPHCKALGSKLDGRHDGMVLNFSFQSWCPACLGNRQGAIEKIAIHEFGHAIGFAHEQNRTDAPDWCSREAQGSPGDWYITLYDPSSIMNYCNSHWNNDGYLSDLDIEAVRTLYGQPDQVPVPVESE